MRRDFTLPEQGAATQVWAAVSPELADIGSVYLADCAIRDDAVPYALDEEHALALWELRKGYARQGLGVNRMDRRKREVRDRILGAAFDLFLSQGVSATTIEEICDARTSRIGLSSTTSPPGRT